MNFTNISNGFNIYNMKYLKKYKVFEEIHPLNTNINELDKNFVSDIIDICADLGDQYPQSDPDRNIRGFFILQKFVYVDSTIKYINLRTYLPSILNHFSDLNSIIRITNN